MTTNHISLTTCISTLYSCLVFSEPMPVYCPPLEAKPTIHSTFVKRLPNGKKLPPVIKIFKSSK